MPEFDAYLTVDWSARSKPGTGADSVWFCLLHRSDNTLSIAALENPSTRHRAVAEITDALVRLRADGRHILVGFDFPYCYPAGFAARLGLYGDVPWRAVWSELAARIVDCPDNRNNRFTVSADFNQRISGGPFPFWGCPVASAGRFLCSRKSRRHSTGDFAEYRITEQHTKGPQPVWKLYGNGSVGSQALLGIPYVSRLRDDPRLADVSRVWPFETGLRELPSRHERDWSILHAEIYPSLVASHPAGTEVKDSAQVRTLATHFAELDAVGRLSALFAGAASLTDSERDQVEREEGWILGVGRDAGSARASRVSAASAAPQRIEAAGLPRRSTTTDPGYVNRNGQVVIRATGLPGTDYGQYIYVLRCSHCAYEYGANGSDVHLRRCPECQGGAPGLAF
jgi:hypothetical protein